MLLMISLLAMMYIPPQLPPKRVQYLKQKARQLYLPLLMLPFVSYLIIADIRPVISFHLKQKLANIHFYTKQGVNRFYFGDNEEQAKVKVAARWKMKDLFSFVYLINLFIYLILYVRPFEVMHLDYTNEDVHPVDQCILYIHTVLTYLVQIPFSVITMPLFTMCRKISFVSALSMLISINIIYMLCYSFPRMAVEIFHDPLLVMYRCFTTTGIILSFYPLLLWYCEGIALLCMLAVRQACMTSSWFKRLFYCFISIVVLFSLLYIPNIQLFGLAVVTEFYSSHQYFARLSSSMGFLTFFAFQPIHYIA